MRPVRDASAKCTIEIESERKRNRGKQFLTHHLQCHGEAIQHSRTTFSWGDRNWNGRSLLVDNLFVTLHLLHASSKVECLWINDIINNQMWGFMCVTWLRHKHHMCFSQAVRGQQAYLQPFRLLWKSRAIIQRESQSFIPVWGSDNESLPKINSRGDGLSNSRWWIQ